MGHNVDILETDIHGSGYYELMEQNSYAERMIKMKIISQSKIRLNGVKDVEEFVKAATKCDFDIDIFYNRIVIDAKSILGILSMDLTKILTVNCHGASKEFDKTLKKFAAA